MNVIEEYPDRSLENALFSSFSTFVAEIIEQMQTAERSTGHDPSEQVIYNRCLFAYEAAQEMVSGNLIELGSGEGYGLRILAPQSESYLAVDKFDPEISDMKNVEFRKLLLPSLDGIKDNTFDFAVSFQVIEHIRNDREFLKEIHRVLKPGGKLIASTPNRLMSLTRNPWHIREYTSTELLKLVKEVFSHAEMKGVFGNEKVMAYYEKNKASVRKITRFDILQLQYRLPGWMLQIPYDFMNRLNRRKLLSSNQNMVNTVTTSDFYLSEATDHCFDLFLIAEK